MATVLRKKDLLFPQLSYKIVGCAFDVFNQLGPGHVEKIYQKAMAVSFNEIGLTFKEQVHTNMKFKSRIIGKYFIDFIIDNSIVVELKKGDHFAKSHIDQTVNYLKTTNLQLAILITFGFERVHTKRILNISK